MPEKINQDSDKFQHAAAESPIIKDEKALFQLVDNRESSQRQRQLQELADQKAMSPAAMKIVQQKSSSKMPDTNSGEVLQPVWPFDQVGEWLSKKVGEWLFGGEDEHFGSHEIGNIERWDLMIAPEKEESIRAEMKERLAQAKVLYGMYSDLPKDSRARFMKKITTLNELYQEVKKSNKFFTDVSLTPVQKQYKIFGTLQNLSLETLKLRVEIEREIQGLEIASQDHSYKPYQPDSDSLDEEEEKEVTYTKITGRYGVIPKDMVKTLVEVWGYDQDTLQTAVDRITSESGRWNYVRRLSASSSELKLAGALNDENQRVFAGSDRIFDNIGDALH